MIVIIGAVAGTEPYFLRNQDRMNYHAIEGMALPIGSGAMESAIRRVVNLRLKVLQFTGMLEPPKQC